MQGGGERGWVNKIILMKYPEIKQIADRLRKNQTPEEKKLWEQLRKHQIHGRKFLRQHVIIYESKDNKHFFFIPDFYCARERLIVEVDGKIHDYQKDRDRNRDEILKAKGLRILRFKNEELDDLGQVLSKIEKMFRRDWLMYPLPVPLPACREGDKGGG